MYNTLMLFAQQEQQDPGFFGTMMFPLLLIFILFMYLMVFLPERQRRKQQQALMSSLKVKDKVLTIGGIIGVISNINEKEDEVTLRLDEGKMRVLRSSIAKVLSGEEQGQQETGIKR